MSIKQSDTVYPQGTDKRREWPTHTKIFKQEAFDCFKNCTGEVVATDTELSYFKGTTSTFLNNRKLTSTYDATNSIYEITTDPEITELLDGMQFRFQAAATNAGGGSLKVNFLTKPILDVNYATLPNEAINEDMIVQVCYVESIDSFVIVGI